MITRQFKKVNSVTVVITISSDEEDELGIAEETFRYFKRYSLHDKVNDATYWKDVTMGAVTLHCNNEACANFMLKDLEYHETYG